MFKGPQGMSLVGAVDVSMRSIFSTVDVFIVCFSGHNFLFWSKNFWGKKIFEGF